MDTDTDALVAHLRRSGLEPTNVEVKSAGGGLPRSVPETLSAFANGTGGTLLLGLSEDDNFGLVEGFNAEGVREALAQACHDKVQPPLRAPIDIVEFEGGLVVRADIDELDPVDKPCFVVTQGEYYGSYIRSGDGDRRLSHYEVTQLLWNRKQPAFDLDPVANASLHDLDSALVARTIAHAADRAPRTFQGADTVQALELLGAVRMIDGTARPTLGGLLSLGSYPQQYFPQLFVAVVVLPGLTLGERGPQGERFLDNVTVDGPIPVLLAETSIALRRNMSRAAVIRGLGREDRYDYPLEVIRELVANAIMHRDYSPEGRGAHIQVELYPDRLVVKSPGGLFGSVSLDDLGTSTVTSTTRNAALAKLLTDVTLPDAPGETIVESRGSGLLQVVASLKRAGMSPPQFNVAPSRMNVTVPRNALLSPETIDWIGSLGIDGLTDEQHLALAMMRNSDRATSGMLRAWGVDAMTAGRALRNLVDRRLAVRTGGKRYASYELNREPQSPSVQPELPGQADLGTGVETELDAVAQAISAGYLTSRQISEHLGIGYQVTLKRINVLVERGIVRPTRPPRSSKQSYRLTETEEN